MAVSCVLSFHVKCLFSPFAGPGTIYELLRGWGSMGLGRDDFEFPILFPRTKDLQSKGALGKEWSCDYGCAEARLFSLSRGEHI